MIYLSENPIEWPISKRWRYGTMTYMLSDTLTELHYFAEKIGLKRSWFKGKYVPHYALSPTKRVLALSMGAKTVKDFNFLIQRYRESLSLNE